jgi:hypothetical protein
MLRFILFCSGVLCTLAAFTLAPSRVQNAFDVLTSGPWTSSETWRLRPDTVYYRDSVPCAEDNDWYFFPDSTFIMLEDSLFCDPDVELSDTLAGKWVLLNNDDILALVLTDGPVYAFFEIHSIGPQELILHHFEPEPDSASTAVHVHEKIILHR